MVEKLNILNSKYMRVHKWISLENVGRILTLKLNGIFKFPFAGVHFTLPNELLLLLLVGCQAGIYLFICY